MNSTRRITSLRAGAIMAAFVAAFTLAPPPIAGAESTYKVLAPTAGGLSPTADITAMSLTNGKVTINWNGFGGPYVLERKSGLGDGAWEEVGIGEDKWMDFATENGSSFFRVKAPSPVYKTDSKCAECHTDRHSDWMATRHAGALETLTKIGMDKNPECLKCHTVGYGIETGFQDAATTPLLANVQCESCHGPAAQHVANPNDLTKRPVLTESANLCGGCHSGYHHPTLENWSTALHSKVDPHVAEYFEDPINGTARMNSCGACHSGAVRSAFLKAYNKGTAVTLPAGHEAATTGVTCVACHDPHKPNLDGTASLRYPLSSQKYFSYNTSTAFSAQFDPTIQTCGQCHNQRGAAAKDTSRPPHHSPQYNVLIGDIGPDGPAIVSGPHTKFTKQCTTCHVHSSSPAEPTEVDPVNTGHTFKPNTEACVTCHQSAENAETKIATTQADIKAKIQEVRALLDQWGETKAPEALRTKYGKLAWEYNSVGQISNPTGVSGMAGPTSTEQTNVVTEIKKARMYIYMVEHDGSFGVHNGKYARSLLNAAKTNVVNLLSAP